MKYLILIFSLTVQLQLAAQDRSGESTNGSKIDALLKQAQVEQKQGRLDKALDALARTEVLTRKSHDYIRHTMWLIQRSDLQLSRGKINLAYTDAELALKAARLIASPPLLSSALNNFGNVIHAKGFYHKSIASYREAIKCAAPKSLQKVSVYLNLVNALLDTNAHVELVRNLKIATTLLTPHAASVEKVSLLLTAATLAKDAGHIQQVTQLLTLVEHDALAINSPTHLSQLYGLEATVFIGQKNYPKAESLLRKAILQSGKAGLKELEYRWFWQLARTLSLQHKPIEAVRNYQKAVRVAKSIRPALLASCSRRRGRQFHERVAKLYYDFATQLLKLKSTPHKGAAQQARLKQLCLLMEELKVAKIQNYFDDDCVIEKQAQDKVVEDIASKSTAIIHTISLDDSFAIIICIQKQYSLFVAPVSYQKLHKAVLNFRMLVQTSSDNSKKAAQQLYHILIAPIEKQLAASQIKHLVFIPDSALQGIPWSALHDGSNYLTDRFSISSTPVSTLNAPRKLPLTHTKVLMAGITKGLPFVKVELNHLNQIFPGKRLLDSQFTSEELSYQLRNNFYRVIHLATHADFTGGSGDNYLMTATGRMNMKQLEDWIKMSSLRKDGIELLTLSACNTAVGDELNNMGLAGIAIRSGAKSVLASLWPVDDQATSIFMAAFYKNLRTGYSRAEAVRKARIALRKHPNYQHPYYWAPFTLIGNWL